MADADVRFEKLRALARLYADQRPGGDTTAFVPDSSVSVEVATLDDLINLACAEFYDLLVDAAGEQAASKDQSVSVVAGTATYNLNTDVYRILSVVLEWGTTDHEPVDEVSEPERVRFTRYSWGQWSPKGYQRRGATPTGSADLAATLQFFPTPSSAVTANVRYVPTFKRLIEGNYLQAVSGWEKVIALRAGIELREIDDLPTAGLRASLAEELVRIQAMADKRSHNQPARIVDVDALGNTREWLADRRWVP